ncbi:MAG TPA: AAA family ATPase [Actinomycetota bacterium]|nr:AAA family ATPase [Actinomycetota bacterium]
MTDKHHTASAAALISGSSTLRQGRADVFKQRERTKRKRLLRAIVVISAIDAYLWWRYSTGRPLRLPTIPDSFPWEVYLPAMLLIVAIGLMVAMPLLSGRSPHITVYPEQVEVGLTDLKGLDTQVDEVIRTLDVFLGYGTFREELGGTPRRGILFEGPPGTGKTYLAKAMAKQAGVPFLFISATALQSMWFGMTAYRIRSFFKALRKTARKEGGAIGFIEEIDAIAQSRDGVRSSTPAGPAGMERSVNRFTSSNTGGMVNELLIQMQSFDQPRWRTRVRGKFLGWLNGYLPSDWQFKMVGPEYHNILLIAATNRADSLDTALMRPGRFDRRLYFDVPTQSEREDLVDYFLERKSHHAQLDDPAVRNRIAHESFGYTPVMIEHLFDEALLVSLRDGRREMNFDDVMEAKFTEEIGLKQSVTYVDDDRRSVAVHEAGHATVAHFLGQNRRLEVLSIIKRRDSLGLLAHGDQEERFTRTRTEIESGIAIALGGLVAEELVLGESGTGPANDLMMATQLAAQMVGSFGMAGSLISFDAVSHGPIGGANLVAKVLADDRGKQGVEDILAAQKERVLEVLSSNRDVHAGLVQALVERDELVRDEILEVIEGTLAARD